MTSDAKSVDDRTWTLSCYAPELRNVSAACEISANRFAELFIARYARVDSDLHLAQDGPSSLSTSLFRIRGAKIIDYDCYGSLRGVSEGPVESYVTSAELPADFKDPMIRL